ncbi:hypothetical protein RHGRI_026252 [Rhododendron griersonianum]|uniref:AP180 N-terminal homology (ANTH) domain-containing protein n=1 Tax=Rhododendron griersonianum TaxID=479676 RepID=A0AAV6IX42_9ERIC|nr:hypothetical protein RHGRI_026252 [Rhododendron griersonianum]
MGTLQSWRKAYGALKDQTKDVDVAIVKATNHVECPSKERHLRKVLAATSAIRPRADVAYCIHALARRLAKTHNWTVRNYCLLGFNLHISPNFVGLRFVNMEMNCGLLLTVVYFCYCGFFFILNYSYGSDQL